MADTTKETTSNPETTANADELAQKVAALEAEKAKLAEERENYKNMGLKYKGLLDTAGIDVEHEDAVASLTQEFGAFKASTAAELAALKKENEELKIARLGKATSAPIGSGASLPEDYKPKKYTEEQLAVFKQMGITPEQFEATQLSRNR